MIPLFGNNSPKLIEGDDQKRMAKCLKKINKILFQFDCTLLTEMIIRSDGSVRGNVVVKALPRTGHGQGGTA